MRFRLATNQDKNIVLNFCKNTFTWGDYIDRVWDIWIDEPNSRLLVAETENNNNIKKPVGIIHGILIPEKIIWIDGIRINPEHRKKKIATNLINNILDYGRKNGAVYSSAIVSKKNQASKKMMEKLNFEVISKWSYISTTQITYSGKGVDSKCKLADIDDYQQIVNFLNLENPNVARTKFVDFWRWYNVTKDMILDMIYNNQIIIIRKNNKNDTNNNNQEIKGLAILDKERDQYNQNIIQIGFIDAESEELLSSLIANSIDIVLNDNRYYKDKNDNLSKIDNRYEKLQIFTPFRENNFRLFSESNISFNEQFLLYSKKIK